MISIAEYNYTSIDNTIHIYAGDVLDFYSDWKPPTVIISDGPYGIGGFPGDPFNPSELAEWYLPHIEQWSAASTPQTTLWFWNTELGWANVHPLLEKNGWQFVNCHIWDKGLGHIAGNANTKTLRKLPVVTEVCVQYVKRAEIEVDNKKMALKEWLRYEWQRTGLPLSKTNEVCNVKDAASRKYFTQCHLWYFPPPEAFERLVAYANKYGAPNGRPYFSIDGISSLTKDEWATFRAKFKCPFGTTNVWQEPPLNGKERIKNGFKALHLNQKPLKFMRMTIEMSSVEDDVVWEPFGGLCSGIVASCELNRQGFAAEINHEVYVRAVQRLEHLQVQPS